MSTNWEVHKAVVHSVDTGIASVRVPAITGRDLVTLPACQSGFEPPAAGSTVFIAVNHERTEFSWLYGPVLETP